MAFFNRLVRNNAHAIMEFSQDGGVLYAAYTNNRSIYCN